MTAIAFDTLKFAKRLKEAGFTEQQAEALAAAEAELFEETVATKRDIAEIKREIKELEVALRREINAQETTLTREIKEVEAALRRDFKELEVTLKRDMEEMETRLVRDMKDLEYRMTIKLGAMLVVAVGAMAALVKIL